MRFLTGTFFPFTLILMNLQGKRILITGSARRIGKALALACAKAGGEVYIHHGHSPEEAERTRSEIQAVGGRAWIVAADLADARQTIDMLDDVTSGGPLFALVNNAAIFDSLNLQTTRLESWNYHLQVNLTAPFLLSQAFAARLPRDMEGCIVNILDWRALRPGADHLPYTISKAALAALTRSLAIALAPRIRVNGLALGAILPPSDGVAEQSLLESIPSGRWGYLDEVCQALLFLLGGPGYITGEIIHIDGGRHLV